MIEGLSSIGVPYDYNAEEFQRSRLSGKDIEALIFGQRLHGRSLETGQEHGGSISADGSTVSMFGDWSNGHGSARIESNRICFVWSTITDCAAALRNPGGTRANENEYILLGFGGWAFPFSLTD